MAGVISDGQSRLRWELHGELFTDELDDRFQGDKNQLRWDDFLMIYQHSKASRQDLGPALL